MFSLFAWRDGMWVDNWFEGGDYTWRNQTPMRYSAPSVNNKQKELFYIFSFVNFYTMTITSYEFLELNEDIWSDRKRGQTMSKNVIQV